MRKKLYKKERGPRLVVCPSKEEMFTSYEETAHPDSLPPEEPGRRHLPRRFLRESVFGHDGFSIVWGDEV